MRIAKAFRVKSGQEFTVERFRPEDAPGIANLFLTVYGPDYPVDTYYDPERIIEAQRKGDIHPVVCRTPTGDVIAAGCLYRSSAVNPNLPEIGLYMVLIPYRRSTAAYLITRFIGNTLVPELGLDGFFGEAVTNHAATQKVTGLIGAYDTGIELLLMPAAIYEKEKSAPGRVSCVFGLRIDKDKPQKIFVPEYYRPLLTKVSARMKLQRDIVSGQGCPAPDSPSRVDSRFFDSASVLRVSLAAVGKDISRKIGEVEAEANSRNMVVRQWFLNLNDSAIEETIALLRRTGYFLSSYLPRWFGGDAGGDGLLMQKISEEPNYQELMIHSDEAAELLAFIREDRDAVLAEQRKQ
jgi:hypothetical protein